MSAAAPIAEARAKLREWGPVILLALIPALPLLAGSGLVNTRAGGDSPFLLVRVHQLASNLRAGVFPVRWMPQAAYGLGYPLFNFYGALPIYLAAALKLAGFGYIWSVKLTQAFGFVFAGVAAYGFSKELSHRRSVSLLVALVYSCAPFHMVNVYVRGDSLSEFYAFVFFPLILWSLLRLHEKGSTRNAARVALSYAGLVLTHNISAVMFSPFALLYALLLAAKDWKARPRSRTVRDLITSLLALGAGLLLSAWFWLPALAERTHVYLRDMTTGYLNYAQHFRALDLVQRSLLFDYAITADQNPFRMGLLQALLAFCGLLAVVAWWVHQHRVELQGAFAVLLLAASTFMITPLSKPLWDHIPLLPVFQFPWRFLSLQALAASLVVAYLVPEKPRWGLPIALALGLVLLAAALLGLHPERLVIDEADITVQRLMLYEYFTANVGTTIRTDYLPSQVEPRPYTSEVLWQEGRKATPLVIEGQVASAELQALGPISERWVIDVTSPAALLAVQTYYYPGWRAHVDGQPVPIEALPGLGYIGVRLPHGQHEILLQLGRTPIQRVAEVLSALTAILILLALLRDVRLSQHALSVAATTLVAVALLIMGLRMLSPPARAQERLDLTMDFDRIPYLHHNPDGVRFADMTRLTHYELSSRYIQAGKSLTITTYWDGIESGDLAAEMTLVSPARHLFGVTPAIAADESPLTDGRVQHVLRIPASTPRGIDLLAVQVYGPEGEIQPVNARGEPLGTTYLLPVRVDSELRASGDQPILQTFGDRIALCHVQTTQHVAGTLEVTLTWRVSAPPPQNYKTALRLRDPAGWEVARLDTQPGYGFYPTSMWRPGELVHDRYALPLDDGAPPGLDYRLDVTLYEAASLRPTGMASIPEVAITQPTVRDDYRVLHVYGRGIVLSEAQLLKDEWQQGEKLVLVLKWAAVAPVGHDYECHIALLDSTGTAVHGQRAALASTYPTSLWPKDTVVAGRYELPLAADIAVGDHTLVLALKEAPAGEELGSFTLPEPVRIVEAGRNFTVPKMQQPVDAAFGNRLRLLGYDLQRAETSLRLTLHWQALTAMDTDYKVFVHLFDPATETIVAQQDALAGGESYPTTRWVADEVVSDETEFLLERVPRGSYRLAVGLYYRDTRLSIVAPQGFPVSADRLLLNERVRVP